MTIDPKDFIMEPTTAQGHSASADGSSAVAEATVGFPPEPDIVFAFCSATQDADAVAAALAKRFPEAPIAGCTTSGEHLDGAHYRGQLVVTALYRSGVSWAATRVEGLASFDGVRAERVIGSLQRQVAMPPDEDPERSMALLFIDGLCLREEPVAALLAQALAGIPLAGGSAGDDLEFTQTKVIHRDGAATDAMVIVLARPVGDARFGLFKHQHFERTEQSLVVTRADKACRRVYEFDGWSAIDAYANALGKPVASISDETFLHPVTFGYRGELYVRSIQQLHDDGSITFYCAVEEGMVLDIAEHKGQAEALRTDLKDFVEQLGVRPSFMLGFNCILRALEADQTDAHTTLGRIMLDHTDHMVGFDTYGEQLGGLHINQTLVVVALVAA